jgi:hypothetical protein
VGSDVPVDDEAPVVTSRISRSAGAQSFEGAHRVCVRVVSVCVVLCESKKNIIVMQIREDRYRDRYMKT